MMAAPELLMSAQRWSFAGLIFRIPASRLSSHTGLTPHFIVLSISFKMPSSGFFPFRVLMQSLAPRVSDGAMLVDP
jgi:hypothetical protein